MDTTPSADPGVRSDARQSFDSEVLPTIHAPLQRYVRALWGPGPQLAYTEGGPFIAGRTIHLPLRRPTSDRTENWHWYRAAAAHAAAHLVFSPPVFDGSGAPPLTRALIGLLEDARVEALACRELPGLRGLWASLHTASPTDTGGPAVLMRRLARSLIDPTYDDPHPWVTKGRSLFFADAAMRILALRRPDELRVAASLLGNDIGQMRLPFSAKGYEVEPDYRDDMRWMWPSSSEARLQSTARSAVATVGTGGAPPAAASRTADTVYLYPEWDRLISRLRHDWCRVVDRPAGDASDTNGGWSFDEAANHRPRRLLARHRRPVITSRAVAGMRSDRGERLDPDALVDARIAQRVGQPVDLRIFRAAWQRPEPGSVATLIDQSASSAGAWGTSGVSLLHASCTIAAWLTDAWMITGAAAALYGFSSNGRRAVTMRVVKSFADPFGAATLARLTTLRSGDSTRLGAAIRHAAALLDRHGRRGPRRIVVVGDGQPFDVDIFDPKYLVEDARRAVLLAAKMGVRVHCVLLDPAGSVIAERIFGARQVGLLQGLDGLPGVVRRLGL